jgi:hypothetical protein
MEKALFAIRMTKSEKKAMDYTAKELSNTLSKIYYPYITSGLFNWLGIIIMYKMEVKRPGTIDKYINYFLQSEDGISTAISPPAGMPGKTLRDLDGAQKELPPVIFEFINLMEKKGLKARFDKVFTRVEFQESEIFLSTMDLNQTAFNLGRQYFQLNKDFSRTDFNLMKDVFFSNMLNEYFQATAVGSIKTLQFEWYNKRASISAFKSILIKQYNKAIAKQPVEARVLPPVKKRKR